MEKQVAWAQQEGGSHDASVVRAYHERAMAYAMSELHNDIQFEADQWIIAEMEKRKAKAQSPKPEGKATPKSKGSAMKAKTASKAKPAAAKAKAPAKAKSAPAKAKATAKTKASSKAASKEKAKK